METATTPIETDPRIARTERVANVLYSLQPAFFFFFKKKMHAYPAPRQKNPVPPDLADAQGNVLPARINNDHAASRLPRGR